MVLLRLPLPPEVKYVSVVYIVFCGEEKESVIWVQRIFFFFYSFFTEACYIGCIMGGLITYAHYQNSYTLEVPL